MISVTFTAKLGSGIPTFTTNVTDLEIAWVNGAPRLYTAARPGAGAGYAAFDISVANTPAGTLDVQAYSAFIGHGSTPQIAVAGDALIAAGLTPSGWASYLLAGNGAFGGVLGHPLTFDPTAVAAATVGAATYVYLAPAGSSQPLAYQLTAAGVLNAVGPTVPVAGPAIDAMAVVQTSDGTYLLTASATANSISSHMIGTDGAPALAAQMSSDAGTGFSKPTAVAGVTLQGITYVIAAASQSSSLSVFRLLPGGGFYEVDHVVDNLSTRFAGATALATLQTDGRVYVFAGGADGGIDVMTLLPDGRLVHLQTIQDTAALALADVAAIAAARVGARIKLFAASETEAGITQIDLGLGVHGVTLHKPSGAAVGTAYDDLICAGAGTTAIYGGGGDDIIVSGGPGSAAMLYGGAGRDIFVLTPGQPTVTIADYQIGTDRLDLTSLPMLRNTGQLTITATAAGADIVYLGTTIHILSDDGNPLPATAFAQSEMLRLDRFAPGATLEVLIGSAAADALAGPELATSLIGLDGDDTLTGGGGNDRLEGNRGCDSLFGGDGADFLSGDEDDDALDGGDGGDMLIGGAGNDNVAGGAGDDTASGDAGTDTQYGGDGNDLLSGGGGNDQLIGGTGDDSAFGGQNDDTLLGGDGNDQLAGDSGNDSLYGESGNDSLFGGAGLDRIFGGDGANLLDGGTENDWLTGGTANDTLQGGDGADSLAAWDGNDRLFGGAGLDTLDGGSGDDLLYGDGGDDILQAGVGNDSLYGGPGRDSLFGGDGQNLIDSGTDNDSLYGGGLRDTLFGGDGDDYIAAFVGDDLIHGGNGADTLGGAAGSDTLYGGSSNDVMNAGDGDDIAYGDAGHDVIWCGAGNDQAFGGSGCDTIYGGVGFSVLDGGANDDFVFGNIVGDQILGGDGNDYLVGNKGNDRVYGGNGADAVSGGPGADLLYGGAGNDTVPGSTGADSIFGDAGSDIILPGTGADRIRGGSGADVFVFQRAADAGLWSDCDRILDFTRGQDSISLAGMGLSFGGAGRASGSHSVKYFVQGSGVMVHADLTGDGIAEMSLYILGIKSLSASDFHF